MKFNLPVFLSKVLHAPWNPTSGASENSGSQIRCDPQKIDGLEPVRSRSAGIRGTHKNRKTDISVASVGETDPRHIIDRTRREIKKGVSLSAHPGEIFTSQKINNQNSVGQTQQLRSPISGFRPHRSQSADGRLEVRDIASPAPSVSSSTHKARQAAPQRTSAQNKVIAFVEGHLNSNPLDFMEAVAKRNSKLAGYFAYQIRRMETPVGQKLPDSLFCRSAYPGILVKEPGHSEMFTGASVCYEDPEKHAASLQDGDASNIKMHVLLSDLKKAIDRQNRRTNNGGLAPTPVSRVKPSHAHSAFTPEVFEAMPPAPGAEELKWLRSLTAKHPAATVFLSFVREGLLLQGTDPENRCERFNYANKNEFSVFNSHAKADRAIWGATFLDGIERDPRVPGNEPASWRIRNGDAWIYGANEKEIMQHVMLRAITHLDATAPPPAGEHLYPLCAYELLAKAMGKRVPQYLKNHEQQVVAMVTANKEAAITKLAQQKPARGTSLGSIAKPVVPAQAVPSSRQAGKAQATVPTNVDIVSGRKRPIPLSPSKLESRTTTIKAGLEHLAPAVLHNTHTPSFITFKVKKSGPFENESQTDYRRKRYLKEPRLVQVKCDEILKAASNNQDGSVSFPLNWIPTEMVDTGSGKQQPRPIVQLAAIAMVAIVRHEADSGKPPRIINFDVSQASDESLYKELFLQSGQFIKERAFQALIRPAIVQPTQATPPEDFFNKDKPATFVPQAIAIGANNQIILLPPPKPLCGELNGIEFSSGRICLQNAYDKASTRSFDEPSAAGIKAAGTVVIEEGSDGRVWVVEPTNHFARLRNTFPKGNIESNSNPRQTAVKETFEETGLVVELVGFLCDRGVKQPTRYYLAKRVSGTPEDVEWESQAVRLVPKNQLQKLFSENGNDRDEFVANQLLATT